MQSLNEQSEEVADFQTVQSIIALSKSMSDFWSNAHGWAPDDAAKLLSKSRLDWQVSLSEALLIWVEKETMSDGELILAWANLGALAEGALKLFLSIYYQDFQADVGALKKANAYDHKKQSHKAPDGLTLDVLRRYASEKDLFQESERSLIHLIQERRNAVHAFQNRELGTSAEFKKAVRGYLGFLKSVDSSIPYPHHHGYYS